MKVAWSPVDPCKFISYCNNVINLCETKIINPDGIPKGCVSLSETQYAKNVATLSDIHLMKCVAWYPGKDNDNLLAVGHANGKILLSNFGQAGNCDLAGKELIPKHLRQCTYLAWNPVHHNLLAEGLDKHRNDCCICIWDVTQRASSDLPTYERQRYTTTLSENAIFKPYLDIGMGETTSSFAWFHKEPRSFVAGMNHKCLRLYDIRDPSKPYLVAHTKYVSGACTDTLDETRVASYCESSVAVWDVRMFDKPILNLPADKNILKIKWCTLRTGVLAVLSHESPVVKLYDIRHSLTGTDEFEPVIFERSIQPDKHQTIAHFAWHPLKENRMMTVTTTGILKDNQIFEKLPMSLSPGMNLAWVFGRKVVTTDIGSQDMATMMKERVLRGYGLHNADLWYNAVVVAEEPHLHALWHWLDLSSSILRSEEGPSKKGNRMSRYVGVLDVLALDKLERQSFVANNMWQYPDGSRSNSRERTLVNQYRSDTRSRALQLCGWWYDSQDGGDPLTQLLDSLVSNNKEYERAAAIALFNLKIGKALEILSSPKAVEENTALTSVAMALSGFTEERNAMWRKTCYELRNTFRNSYLRAMFAFLACDRENFEDVLTEEPGMAVKDRVAFACIYLNDSKLHNYLEDLSRKLKNSGNLDGILLTGLTGEEGLELLGNYVDMTSDIQTATLAVVYSAPSDLIRDERVNTWIESYRGLLDRWQLWHQRAKFDIIRHSIDTARVPGQAFVSCNYCGKSVACNMTLATRSRQSNYSMLPPTNKPKITCCPGCRKPLPRCALCLTNLGTPSGSGLCQLNESAGIKTKLSPFDNWFAWCQSCRHGGHSTHITDWFREHSECPVTGCSCKCMSLDISSQLCADISTVKVTTVEG